ncbi:energy transducer TonB [Pelagicoccus sp. SDUM812002]|uniref:energy transducer TonB n=1 Tax=Pelagicoccus sp. SDUM812002 TaxID=3041266 RepID=UPI00280C9197|nr:energy transducer TonB [Pelagicoccus sp. SDUM812002]MDQ8186335.1 hypothetical protein [Pelagicoccus sp. SDUM812002]
MKRSGSGPTPYLGAIVTVMIVFISMGAMHTNIDIGQRSPTEPISEFHLPPPPPPPAEEPPPEKSNISISFNLPATDGPASIPLGFLKAEFGLKPQELTKTEFDIDESITNYQTDGLDTLKIYSQDEVTDKPKRTYHPKLDIPYRFLRGNKGKTITFIVLYTVTSQGRTENIHVLDCPVPAIIPFVESYIKGWRLKPATKDGKPVNSWVQHKFTYHPPDTNPFSQ